ncbi:MAG: transporter ATP-binding protein, partial [Frondihabitans sp.]|nr:transporter ATP-binding protein [Frondihabitans sp.]
VTDGADEAVILRSLVDAGVAVRGFETSKLSLDDIFLRVYGDENVLEEV